MQTARILRGVRVFRAFAVALSAVVVAAGCAPGSSGMRGEGDALVYWRTLTGAAGDAQDALVARYNASEPELPAVSEFQGSYADLAAKVMTAAAAGRGPDVTQLGTFEIREFARAGLLVDLRPFLTGPDGVDTSDWPGTMLQAGEVDGGLYWLPFNVAVPVLYYNQDVFDAAGVAPPETWTDFFALCRDLTERKGDGSAARAGVALWDITWPFVSMVWSEGGELTDRDYDAISLNHPVVVDVMAKVQALVRDGAATLPDKASGGHRAAFLSGRAAMILDSPAAFTELTRDAAFEVGVVIYPAGAAGRVYAPGGGGIAMLSVCPEDRRPAAWAFMKSLLSPEALADYAQRSGYLAFTDAARAAAADWLADPRVQELHRALPYIRGDFSVTAAPPVRTAFDEAFHAIVIKGVDAKQALDAANARAIEGMRRESADR